MEIFPSEINFSFSLLVPSQASPQVKRRSILSFSKVIRVVLMFVLLSLWWRRSPLTVIIVILHLRDTWLCLPGRTVLADLFVVKCRARPVNDFTTQITYVWGNRKQRQLLGLMNEMKGEDATFLQQPWTNVTSIKKFFSRSNCDCWDLVRTSSFTSTRYVDALKCIKIWTTLSKRLVFLRWYSKSFNWYQRRPPFPRSEEIHWWL